MNTKTAGKAFAGITAFAITIGGGINLVSPDVIAGSPHSESGSYFIPTHEAPAIPMRPMPLPEWAEPTSPNGAPITHYNAWEVYYTDGIVLWQDDDGNVYWDMTPYTYNT